MMMSEHDSGSPTSQARPTSPAPEVPKWLDEASVGGGGKHADPKPGRRSYNPLVLVLVVASAFFAMFLLVSGAAFYSLRGPSPAAGGTLFNAEGVGVLEVNGVIMDSRSTLRKLDELEEDARVKALVVRINSPGGAVAPSQEIHDRLKAFPRPVVVSMGSVAASGGYYIAAAADTIFANPGTLTGSIGVIMEFADLSRLYQWAKVDRYALKTGKFKDAGAEYKPMDAESRALLQGVIDDVLSQFRKAVADGRKLPEAKVAEVADGRIFSGSQARALGLVDELGGIDEAVGRAARLAKIKGKPERIYPSRPRHGGLLDMLLEDQAEDEAEARSSLRELAAGLRGLLGLASLLGGGPGLEAESSVGRSDPSLLLMWQPGSRPRWR